MLDIYDKMIQIVEGTMGIFLFNQLLR